MTALPWHQPLVDTVRARLAAGALPHALLLAGPEGWGELALANWLALELLGIDGPRDVSTVAHPDLRWIAPEGAVIKVDAVRDLVAFAHGTPQSGPRKVAVVADAHFLNVNAANALLKTLEEPPPGTHVVLYSCHPGRLLPTIRSRCQTLVIRPDPALARRWLEAHAPAEDLERRMLEHGGAPVAVMAALERGEQPLDELIERVFAAGASRQVVQSLLESGLAGTLARWHRYVLALAAGEWQPRRLADVSRRSLMEFADELIWARRQLVTSNSANERLLAERLIARWHHLERASS
jgi:DNA polymerase-3 subunit delta'